MEDTIDVIIGIIEENEPIFVGVVPNAGYENRDLYYQIRNSNIMIKSKTQDVDLCIKTSEYGFSIKDNEKRETYITVSKKLDDGTEVINTFKSEYDDEDDENHIESYMYLLKNGCTELIKLINQTSDDDRVEIINEEIINADSDELMEYVQKIQLGVELDKYISGVKEIMANMNKQPLSSTKAELKKLEETCDMQAFSSATEFLDEEEKEIEDAFSNYSVTLGGNKLVGSEKIMFIRKTLSQVDRNDVDRINRNVQIESLYDVIQEHIERIGENEIEK